MMVQFMDNYVMIIDDNGRDIRIPYLEWIKIVSQWRLFIKGLRQQ